MSVVSFLFLFFVSVCLFFIGYRSFFHDFFVLFIRVLSVIVSFLGSCNVLSFMISLFFSFVSFQFLFQFLLLNIVLFFMNSLFFSFVLWQPFSRDESACCIPLLLFRSNHQHLIGWTFKFARCRCWVTITCS